MMIKTMYNTIDYWKTACTRTLPRLLLAIMIFLHHSTWLLAQQKQLRGVQDDITPAVVKPPSRSLVFETFIILLFSGAALFAICKSSRRT